MSHAIYTVKGKSGRHYQVRASTFDSCGVITSLAQAQCADDEMLDVVSEIRALKVGEGGEEEVEEDDEHERDDDDRDEQKMRSLVSEFIGPNDDFVEIPIVALEKKGIKLLDFGLDDVRKKELWGVGEYGVEQLVTRLASFDPSNGTVEDDPVVIELEEVPDVAVGEIVELMADDDCRPFVQLTVIEAHEEKACCRSLFDD